MTSTSTLEKHGEPAGEPDGPKTSPLAPRDVDDKAERVFVGAVWLAMSGALVVYVALFARDVPYQEDWELAPVLTGNRPFRVSWLVEQLVEHRYILAKALLYPIWLVGGDFRAPMFLDALLLAALALASVRVARALRGRAAFADAFFPVALLHWGHGENIIFFSQMYYVLPVVLVSAATLLIATGRWESRGGAAALGLAVLLLPLNGGIGMLLAPPLVVWTAYAALKRRRETWVLLAAAGATAVIAGLYVVGYRGPPSASAVPRTLRGATLTTLEVFGVSLGGSGASLWPVVGLAAAALFVATGCILAFVAELRPAERVRAAGLLACLTAVALVAAGIGFGRTVLGPGAGLPGRYALLITPGLCCVFLACILYGGPVVGRVVQAALFACACALLGANVPFGLDYARFRVGPADALVADVRAGLPPLVLAQRYRATLYPNQGALAERLAMLRDRRAGPYKDAPAEALAADGPLRAVPVPVSVVGSNQVRFEGEVARGLGTDPYVIYALPSATYVCGIRFEYTLANEEGEPAKMQAFWKRTGRDDFAEQRNCTLEVASGPQPQSETVWIYDEIDQFRIDPDTEPCTFRLSGMTLLVRE